MIGSLQNYSEKLRFTQDDIEGFTEDRVRIQSFCTAIELKRHDVSSIVVEGTEFYVKYRDRSHSVTSQSNKQKTSVFNFFNQTIHVSPYITNLIWFTEITGKDVRNLNAFMGGTMISNVFGGNVTAREIMQLLVYQRPPRRYEHAGRVTYSFDCSNGISFEKFDLIVQQFSEAKKSMGELTRKRIEQITRASISESIASPDENKMMIYIQRAIITGKKTLIYFPTVALINRCYEYFVLQQKAAQVAIYHGSLNKDRKAESYEQFLSGQKLVMLATKAFGMGIDINDISIVAHFAPTGNVCDYVQEIGRAARRSDIIGEAIYQ